MQKLLFSFLLLFFAHSALRAQFDGYALYNEQNQKTTYLIDKDGEIAHSWNCDVSCNYAVLLKENGNLMRGGVYASNQIRGAAVGGMVQEIDKNGDVVWEFIYSNADHVQHHDITLMPNGNVLLTAWEVKSAAEMAAAGYTGNKERWATHFVEVAQDGTGGKIVWEWHMVDHLVQDQDDQKDNYGVVADHPELLNVNVTTSSRGRDNDWLHVNGVNYNEELDQIVFSSRYLSEIFVIDHSTTTAEAASHSGGNAGKGGDFLYRWGNPSNYGATGNKVITAAVHDVRWIPNDGRPNAGYIQFFNNEGGTGGSSTVDAIDPPLNGYNYDLTKGEAYGPSTYSWRHECRDDADGQSASNRMPNGNTFVNLSRTYMYEVDADDNLVWQYNAKPAKAFRYTCDYVGIQALLDDPCEFNVGTDEPLDAGFDLFPNPSNGVFHISGINATSVHVFDAMGNEIQVSSINQTIDLSSQPAGIYYVRLSMEDATVVNKKLMLVK